MSATPVINNLFEARKLLEIVTGRSFGDLDTKPTVMNALATHRNLMVYGFRYKADFAMKVNPVVVKTGGNHLIDELRGTRGVLQTEQILLDAKLEKLFEEGHFRKGTLVYLEYVDRNGSSHAHLPGGARLQRRGLHRHGQEWPEPLQGREAGHPYRLEDGLHRGGRAAERVQQRHPPLPTLDRGR
jgi:hypothetical protein